MVQNTMHDLLTSLAIKIDIEQARLDGWHVRLIRSYTVYSLLLHTGSAHACTVMCSLYCDQARTQSFEKGGYIAKKIPIEFLAF